MGNRLGRWYFSKPFKLSFIRCHYMVSYYRGNSISLLYAGFKVITASSFSQGILNYIYNRRKEVTDELPAIRYDIYGGCHSWAKGKLGVCQKESETQKCQAYTKNPLPMISSAPHPSAAAAAAAAAAVAVHQAKLTVVNWTQRQLVWLALASQQASVQQSLHQLLRKRFLPVLSR